MWQKKLVILLCSLFRGPCRCRIHLMVLHMLNALLRRSVGKPGIHDRHDATAVICVAVLSTVGLMVFHILNALLPHFVGDVLMPCVLIMHQMKD